MPNLTRDKRTIVLEWEGQIVPRSSAGGTVTTVGGDPILDTYTLNEGIKGFDGETGDRLWGPVSTLQLTCNGYE